MVLFIANVVGGIGPPPANSSSSNSIPPGIIILCLLIISAVAIIPLIASKKKTKVQKQKSKIQKIENAQELGQEAKVEELGISEENIVLLKKYKQLLDNELISKEEYDDKVNAILTDNKK